MWLTPGWLEGYMLHRFSELIACNISAAHSLQLLAVIRLGAGSCELTITPDAANPGLREIYLFKMIM